MNQPIEVQRLQYVPLVLNRKTVHSAHRAATFTSGSGVNIHIFQCALWATGPCVLFSRLTNTIFFSVCNKVYTRLIQLLDQLSQYSILILLIYCTACNTVHTSLFCQLYLSSRNIHNIQISFVLRIHNMRHEASRQTAKDKHKSC